MNYRKIGHIRAQYRELVKKEPHDGPYHIKSLSWNLQYYTVCASTETEIDRSFKQVYYLNKLDKILPYGIIAYRQRSSYGQKNRQWKSPIGGIWLSVAFSWSRNVSLPLAVIEGLCLQLERMNVHVQFKWPNDLVINNRKLVGILPRLVIRSNGSYVAKVGIGLNVRNITPPEGISLFDITLPCSISLDLLVAKVLRGLEWSIQNTHKQEFIRQSVEKRLIGLGKPFPCKGFMWKIVGLDINGGIMLSRRNQTMTYKSSF
uniref:Putative Biotin--acetyl-CoA-carboxylase ligase n=1 Tax=Paulinella micropora TaxID=1928728 RepID=A0A1L5YCR1_9EUKA|nr:putative Biotin--acetyl-CoA-carboxylase ligase [Paulinella micropora]